MGQFKPMVKMMTTEPSVILKLKKGGHVAPLHKDADGHTNMKGDAFKAKYSEESCEGESPKKPSMSDRRKAMSGALLNSKKGGKAVKKADGGMMGAPAMAAPMRAPMGAAPVDPRRAALMRAMMARRGAGAAPMAAPAAPMGMPAMKKGGKAKHEDAAEDRAMIKKAMAGKKFASGGAIDKFETKTTIEGNAGKFAKTKMHDGDKADRAHGTGMVKMGKPAGYKTGGTIEGNEGTYAKTKVVDGDKLDRASGTKGIKMGQPAAYKKGGGVNWENRPANDGDKFDPAHGTTGVRESNAGGYKKGGAAKKHFATGGAVDTGRAVAMPRKAVSQPVSNSRQSGTFKKGGKVERFDGGSTKNPALQFAPDQDRSNVTPQDVKDAKARAKESAAIEASRKLGSNTDGTSAIQRLLGLGSQPTAPISAYKKGGNAKC